MREGYDDMLDDIWNSTMPEFSEYTRGPALITVDTQVDDSNLATSLTGATVAVAYSVGIKVCTTS